MVIWHFVSVCDVITAWSAFDFDKEGVRALHNHRTTCENDYVEK